MAIAFNQTTSNSDGGVTSITVNHAAAGSERIAIIGIYAEGGASAAGLVSSISYGAQTPTLIARVGDSGELSMYRMIAPSTGTQTVTVNFSGTATRVAIGVVSYTGVDQTSPLRDSDSSAIDGTTVSLTVDSTSGDRVIDCAAAGWDSMAPNASQNELVALDDFASTFRSFGVSERAGQTTSTAMSWTAPEAVSMFQIAATLIPSSAAATTTLSPTTGAINVQGRLQSVNPFTNVAIREVFINEAGSPVSNRTGMHLLVWYAGKPVGAADLSYSNLTTDAAGTASWSLPPGGILYNQYIFYVAHDGSTSLSMYTCARLIPTFS